ncbi:YqaE/Pmp3 family membrane protein [Sneathiella litorea]|uniref:YqaE/Pmp3 family membrane protein n=1 Tax=Sneathiella litorea TaxID=2606216 RepID=A0A6L8W731_9PROT|nr:YqaE/Pmp3 family membrane protein [Sneathiella litorea]MZR30878.1 YqaE/Pmp3 family membrane protein [Sneathiella litorea]
MFVSIGILLPWLIFFMLGRTVEGIICLILQLTVIGWPPAAFWALMTQHRASPSRCEPRALRPEK